MRRKQFGSHRLFGASHQSGNLCLRNNRSHMGIFKHVLMIHMALLCCAKGPRGSPSNSCGETNRASQRCLALPSLQCVPLTLFIRVLSVKAMFKKKPPGQGCWKKISEYWGKMRMEKKGRLGAPGYPEVRQRRYPCLRQEFHSIGSIKAATGIE